MNTSRPCTTFSASPSTIVWVVLILLSLCAVSIASADTIEVDLGRGPISVEVPSSYVEGTPLPLVLLLHGYTSSGAFQESFMQIAPLAEERGFFYAHPDGTVDGGGDRFWNATDACCNFFGSDVDDSSYLRGLIEAISEQVTVDPDRVFLIGHSNGGFMSYRMACDHADLIRGIASLAGATYLDANDCNPERPVRVLQVHGTADDTILYAGGAILGTAYPSAVATVEQWAAFNGCVPEADGTSTARDLDAGIAGAETTVAFHSGCVAGGAAELWTIPDGTHVPQITAGFSGELIDFLFETNSGGGAFDLQRKEMQFLRRPKGMSVVRAKVGFKSLIGDRIDLGDDDAQFFEFPGGEVFEFGEGAYRGFWVHSDGHLTFEDSDTATSLRDVGRFFDGPPRIAALFADLDPRAAADNGGVYVTFIPGRARVTWLNVPDKDGGLNSVQATLFFQTGRVLLVFGDQVETQSAVVGARAFAEGLHQMDYTAELPFRPPQKVAVAESFGGSP